MNSVVEPYTLFGQQELLEQYINFLKKKFEIGLKRIYEYELLYTQELTLTMIESYLNNEIGNLLSNSFTEKIVFDKEFTTQDIGKQTQNGETIQNYQGFDLTNQDGQFSKQGTNQTQSGGTSKLQYLAYLQTYTSDWIKKVIDWIVANVCILIY